MSRFEKLWAAMYADIRKSIFNLCKFHNFEPTWQQGDVLERVLPFLAALGVSLLVDRRALAPGRRARAGADTR